MDASLQAIIVIQPLNFSSDLQLSFLSPYTSHRMRTSTINKSLWLPLEVIYEDFIWFMNVCPAPCTAGLQARLPLV